MRKPARKYGRNAQPGENALTNVRASASPTSMYLPPVDYLTVFENIVMIVLGRRKAGMIGEDSQPVADLKAVEHFIVLRFDHSVLLRHSRDAHVGFVSFDVQYMPVAARWIKLDRAAVFR